MLYWLPFPKDAESDNFILSLIIHHYELIMASSEFEFDYLYAAIGSCIAGTILAVFSSIESPTVALGLTAFDMIMIGTFITGLMFVGLTAADLIDEHGYLFGGVLIFFTALIEFASPETIMRLLPWFVILDVILGIAKMIDRKR